MNEEHAKKRAATLKSKIISGWKIGSYLGSGKSAFVCKAKNGVQTAAIKIFETEFLEEKEIRDLKIRLNRQLSLCHQKHPNLIEIYDGGYSNDYKCYYLVMQYIKANPLSKIIKSLPKDKIGSLITQISSAARFLESLGIAHRDIKPDNIVVTDDYSSAVLLDLGVIRPLGDKGITDSTNSLRFVGTLRYSSPEFLFRVEKDTKEGWRAVTFYQLGAVLHDMIMSIPIFEGQTEPYAKLVHAIEHETPNIYCEGVDPALIHLARLCLLKDPTTRLKMVDWEEFIFPRQELNKLQEVKNRIRDRKEAKLHNCDSKTVINKKTEREKDQLVYDIRSLVDKSIRETCIGNDLFPKILIVYIETTEGKFNISVNITFSSSERHSLSSDFTIIVTILIVDLSEKLVQFQCAGKLGNRIELPEALPYLSLFYEGFIDDQQLPNIIEDMIHVMFDQAQLKCESLLPEKTNNPWIIYKFKEE